MTLGLRPRYVVWSILLLGAVGCTATVELVNPNGGGTDAAVRDSGTPGPDAGARRDGGLVPDAGVNDAGSADAGSTDAGHADAGAGDAGTTGKDAGSGDAGFVGADVLQHHLNATRDGFYTDPYLTKAAIAGMHVDTAFAATVNGSVYAQPLYMANGAGGKPSVFVATQLNDIYALDAATGAQLWHKNLGTPAQNGDMGCGSIFPMGVLGTPVLDPASRKMFIATLLHVNNAPQHTVFALSVDDGTVTWSLDVGATIANFPTNVQGQRAGLLFLNGMLYVPYGGLNGDCGNYHGWVIAIPPAAPTTATGWATAAPSGAGIWAASGIASDGTSLFVATGNTNNSPFPTVWANADSEAVIRLSAGSPPTFSGAAADYSASLGSDMKQWYDYDTADADLGSSGVVLFDIPGANPSHLALAVGKTAETYLVDRSNLGGISDGLQASNNIFTTGGQVMGSLFAYRTPNAAYVGMRQPINQGCNNGDMSVLKVSAATPPQLSFAWCANSGGDGVPIASTSGNLNDVVVWTYGSNGDEQLRAYDGDTGGTALYTSSGLPRSTHWNTPIIAGGRVYVAGNGVVSALTVH